MIIHSVKSKLQRFCRDESGVAAIELLFVVPILFWVLMSTLVFFDGFRAKGISVRAALTVADMVSREEDPVNAQYVDGTKQLLRALTESEDDPDVRMTAYQYSEGDDRLLVIWSETDGFDLAHDDASIISERENLPSLSHGEISLLVETRTRYQAPFRTALPGFIPFQVSQMDQVTWFSYVFISPRPAEVCFEDGGGNEFCNRNNELVAPPATASNANPDV